jgi:hypothetical protein
MDKWFGDVYKKFFSKRSSQLSGEVFFYKGNYVVKWNNAYTDAHLFFTFDSDGKKYHIKNDAISDLDFSYDFQDLDFKKI